MRRHRGAPLLGRGVLRGGTAANPCLAGDVALRQALDPPAVDPPGKFVGIPGERIIAGLEPEPRQRRRPATRRDERQIARQPGHARFLEPHADALHPVVGCHEHPRESAVAGHAADRHGLRPDRLFHGLEGGLGVADGPLRGQDGPQPDDALRTRIDRALHAAVPGRIDRPQGHDEVLELEQRPPARGPDHRARAVDRDPLGGAGEDDVMSLRVDEHVRDPLEPPQKEHVGRQHAALVGRVLDRGDDLGETHLAERAVGDRIAAITQRGPALIGQRLQGPRFEVPHDAVGIDRNPADDGAEAELCGGPIGDRGDQPAGDQERGKHRAGETHGKSSLRRGIGRRRMEQMLVRGSGSAKPISAGKTRGSPLLHRPSRLPAPHGLSPCHSPLGDS